MANPKITAMTLDNAYEFMNGRQNMENIAKLPPLHWNYWNQRYISSTQLQPKEVKNHVSSRSTSNNIRAAHLFTAFWLDVQPTTRKNTEKKNNCKNQDPPCQQKCRVIYTLPPKMQGQDFIKKSFHCCGLWEYDSRMIRRWSKINRQTATCTLRTFKHLTFERHLAPINKTFFTPAISQKHISCETLSKI